MKEKLPKHTGEEISELEDVDALDAGLVSSGPEDDDAVSEALDPETGLPLEDAAFAGLHAEGDGEEEA